MPISEKKKKARFLLCSICEGVALFGVCLSRMWTRRRVGHGLGHHFCEVKYLGIGNSSSKGAIPSMFTKMQRLVFLDCTNCDTMADDVIGKVAECCPLLELFCLNGCKYVYRWTFCTLFRSCSPLRTLLLRYTPVRGLPYGYPMAHPMAYRWFFKLGSALGDGQNTDPQSMDYHNGLPNWTTLKWTTPKNNNPNEYYLMFLAASMIKLHKTSAYVRPIQPLATSLNNCT